MATIGDVAAALGEIAPPAYAQAWDNVGLLTGDPSDPCGGILLCIDLRPGVLDEAERAGLNLLACYHPPIFKPIRRLTAEDPAPLSLLWRAARLGCAIYSMHTALDAAAGGTNDVICQACGLTDVQPLDFARAAEAQCKIVVFVPPDDVDDVAEAMFAAGAGWIGQYHHCSFRLRGEGTFWGTEATSPHIGRAGRLERVDEIRLEAVCPRAAVPEVVQAIRAAHPYEEPAFDIYPLEPTPADAGMGRIGKLPRSISVAALARKLKKTLGAGYTLVAGETSRKARTIAVVVGSAGKWALEQHRFLPADVLVTGELKHHDALAYVAQGKTVIALGHWASERPALRAVAEALTSKLPAVPVRISKADRDVWQAI